MKNELAGAGLVAMAIGCGVALSIDGLDFVSEAEAAVTANSFISGQLPRAPIAAIGLGTLGTVAVPFFTAGANGSDLYAMSCMSTDTASEIVSMSRVRGTVVTAVLETATIPINAGNIVGTPPVNMFNNGSISLPLNSDGNPHMIIESGDTLVIQSAGSITNNKTVWCSGVGFDF